MDSINCKFVLARATAFVLGRSSRLLALAALGAAGPMCGLQAETGGIRELPAVSARGLLNPNSDLESDADGNGVPDGWVKSSVYAWTTEDARSGTRSFKVNGAAGEGNEGTYVEVPAVHFRALFIRMWVKSKGTTFNSSTIIQIGTNCKNDVPGNAMNVTGGHTYQMELAGGTEGEWREYVHVLSFPADLHWGHTFRFYLKIAGGHAGQDIFIDDIELRPAIFPLTIFPLYPNYKGMLWTDQSQTMKWQAIVEAPEGEALENLRVETEILNSAGEAVAGPIVTEDLSPVRDESTGTRPYLQWMGVSLNRQTYEATELPEGVYYLRGKLVRKSDGAALYTYVDYKIVKEAPSAQRDAWNVWVDENNVPRIKPRGSEPATPRFIHGAFLRTTSQQTPAGSGASQACATADSCRALAFTNIVQGHHVVPWERRLAVAGIPPGQPPTGLTVLKVLADVGMNWVNWYNNAGSGSNVGILTMSNAVPGGVIHSGAVLEGSGFLSRLKPGYVVHPAGNVPGTGLISVYGRRVLGHGTRFSSELRLQDSMILGGTGYGVGKIVSDSELLLHTAYSGTLQSVPFTYLPRRTIVSVESDTRAIVDEPFPEGMPSGLNYTRCSTYTSGSSDSMQAWHAAVQDFDIWQSNMSTSYSPLSVNAPTWQRACRMDERQAVKTLYEFCRSTDCVNNPKHIGSNPGFFGHYNGDEPNNSSITEGLVPAFNRYLGAAEAVDTHGRSFGGISTYTDGPTPMDLALRYNFVDGANADPYPAGFGATADDSNWGPVANPSKTFRLHGRSYGFPFAINTLLFGRRQNYNIVQLFKASGIYSTPKDNMIQVVSSIASGATGVIWAYPIYNSSFCSQISCATGAPGSQDYKTEQDYVEWQSLTKRLIQDNMPILETPLRDLTGRLDEEEYGRDIRSQPETGGVADYRIRCSSRRLDSRVLLACVNTENAAKTVTIPLAFTIPPGAEIKELVGETTIAPAGDGTSITDSFNSPFENAQTGSPHLSAKLYLIDLDSGAVRIRGRR